MDHTVLLGWMLQDWDRQARQTQLAGYAMRDEAQAAPVAARDTQVILAADYAAGRQARRDIAQDPTRRAA